MVIHAGPGSSCLDPWNPCLARRTFLYHRNSAEMTVPPLKSNMASATVSAAHADLLKVTYGLHRSRCLFTARRLPVSQSVVTVKNWLLVNALQYFIASVLAVVCFAVYLWGSSHVSGFDTFPKSNCSCRLYYEPKVTQGNSFLNSHFLLSIFFQAMTWHTDLGTIGIFTLNFREHGALHCRERNNCPPTLNDSFFL